MKARIRPKQRAAANAWLDSLPDGWESKPLKHAVRMNRAVLGENTQPDSIIRYIDISNVDSQGNMAAPEEMPFETAPSRARRIVRDGDTIVSTVRTYLRAIAYIQHPPENLIVSTGFAVLTPRAELEPKFLAYLARSEEFIGAVVAHSTGVSYPAINPSLLGCLPVWFPNRDRQKAIANFLDRETARVDGMIGKKEELLQLLEEKRASLISHAVGRGLDPTAKLRNSSIPWLGKIPVHWKVTRLKRLAVRIKTGGTPSRSYMENEADGTIDWFTPGDFSSSVELADSKRKITAEALRNGEAPTFPGNTVFVVGIGATLGKVGRSINPASANQQINAVIPKPDVDASFLTYALVSQAAQMRALANSSTLPILNQEATGDVALAAPPVEEQGAIVSHVETMTEKLAALIGKITESIALLREHRTALISAAVTGKIDVRKA